MEKIEKQVSSIEQPIQEAEPSLAELSTPTLKLGEFFRSVRTKPRENSLYAFSELFDSSPGSQIRFALRNENWEYESTRLFSSSDFEALQSLAVETNLMLEQIGMNIPTDAQSLMQRSGLVWKLHSSTAHPSLGYHSASFRDSFDNLVIVQTPCNDPNLVVLNVAVPPPVCSHSDPSIAVHGIDLSRIGLGIMEDVINQPAARLVFSVGNFNVYSSNTSQNINPQFFTDLTEGIDNAFSLFGLSAEEHTDSIYIFESDIENAYYSMAAPRMIFVPSCLFTHTDVDTDSSHRSIGFHEAVHTIDDKLKLSHERVDKACSLTEYFKGSRSQFLQELNENNFLPNVAIGGHAQDSPAELLASFLNTLNHPNLNQELNSRPREFQQKYAELSERVILAWRSRGGLAEIRVNEDAPLIVRLRELRNKFE